jgi:hypothetical protein
MKPETQVEACLEQLASQPGLAAKAVEGPAKGGAQEFMERQQAVEGPNAVDGHGQAALLGKGSLGNEHLFLHSHWSTLQAVEAAFAKGYNLRMR